MRISTKGIYALEIVVDLCMNSDEKKPESVKNVAERRNLSEKYLERIIGMLKRAGIVTSIRGAYGGYFLARLPEEITVYHVLEAAEGSLAPVECLTSESKCQSDCDVCVTKDVWSGIWDKIREIADRVTIEDIVEHVEK